jgi:vitamin B12 transporter
LSAFGNIGLGSYGTFKSSVGLSGASNGWDYGISASLADSEGFNAIDSPNTSKDKDGYTQRALSASLGYRWMPGHHIGLTTYNGYNHGDTDAYMASLDPAYAVTRQQIHAITSTDDITDYWQSVLRFGLTRESMENADQSGTTNSIASLQRMYSWQNNLTLAPNQSVSVVLERREERLAGNSGYDATARNTNAAGLIYRGGFGAHHLQASVRNDNISGYGNETTGGLAYDYDINDQWRIGVAGNTGFKAPTFDDMYYPAMYTPYYNYVSNPGLQPEKSKNLEASLRYQTETTKLGVVVYQNKINDLINGNACKAFDAFGFCALNSPANVDSATIRGLTLTSEQRFGATTVRASADFSNPKNDANGNQLTRRARQVYRLNADHRINHWVLGGEYLFVGKRYDDDANKNSLGGYGLLNLTAHYELTKNLAVQVRWNNVLNKDYTTALYFAPDRYNTAGSNVFVNLAWRM